MCLYTILAGGRRCGGSGGGTGVRRPFGLISGAALGGGMTSCALVIVNTFLRTLDCDLFLTPCGVMPKKICNVSVILRRIARKLFSFVPRKLPVNTATLYFGIPLLLLTVGGLNLTSKPGAVIAFILVSVFASDFSCLFTGRPLIRGSDFVTYFCNNTVLKLKIAYIFHTRDADTNASILTHIVTLGSGLGMDGVVVIVSSAIIVLKLLMFRS